ncbi:MAG: radical SAM protein [Candidatus Omnitrophica bacterium]|nr:radical SAM protein [Candidatus Omnitrophota bacterium]
MNKIEKVVIICGYRCNNNCVFCINSGKRHINDKSTTQILREMLDARERGKVYIEFIGGEITIRPDTFMLIKQAKKMGFASVNMATNGRMLSYPDFAKRLVDAGIDELIFSIHGHEPGLHDSLTRVSGSFNELVQGLKNVRKFGLKKVASNTTIVKANYMHLPDIGKFLLGHGVTNSEFIFADPTYGGVHDDFFSLMPRISEAAPFIRKCLALSKNNKSIRHWHIRYVPLCYFRGYLENISEIHEVENFHTEHLAPDFRNQDVENSRKNISRQKPSQCRGCKLFGLCEGIWKEYLIKYGAGELKNIKSRDN